MFGCEMTLMGHKSFNGLCSECVTQVIFVAQSRSPSLTLLKRKVCLPRYVVVLFCYAFREWSHLFGRKSEMKIKLLEKQLEGGLKKELKSNMSLQYTRQQRTNWILKNRNPIWCWRLISDFSTWMMRFSARTRCPTHTPKCRLTLSN